MPGGTPTAPKLKSIEGTPIASGRAKCGDASQAAV